MLSVETYLLRLNPDKALDIEILLRNGFRRKPEKSIGVQIQEYESYKIFFVVVITQRTNSPHYVIKKK